MSSKVTMKTIAEAVGTSVGTVDRALNNRGRINADMKAQILLAAEELGYRPNLSARNLRKDTLFKLLVVVRKDPRYFYYVLQQGIDDALNEYVEFGVQSEFLYTDSMTKEDTCNLLKRMDISDFSALLIDTWYPELVQFALRFQRSNKPVVAVHLDLPPQHRDLYVGPDSRQGGVLCANYMGELLNGRGRAFLLADGTPDPVWCGGLEETLAHCYPHVVLHPLTWDEIRSLEDRDALLVCGAIQPEQQGLLSSVAAPVISTQLNETARQMLAQGQLSAVIYDDPYRQGYQSVKAVVDALIRSIQVLEDTVLIPPQLLLRASLPAIPLPALTNDNAILRN